MPKFTVIILFISGHHSMQLQSNQSSINFIIQLNVFNCLIQFMIDWWICCNWMARNQKSNSELMRQPALFPPFLAVWFQQLIPVSNKLIEFHSLPKWMEMKSSLNQPGINNCWIKQEIRRKLRLLQRSRLYQCRFINLLLMNQSISFSRQNGNWIELIPTN